MKFKRVRNRRDLKNNPAQLSLIIDEEFEGLEALYLMSPRSGGRCGLAAQEGLLTLGQCYFHPFVPAALLMLSHMCFFPSSCGCQFFMQPGWWHGDRPPWPDFKDIRKSPPFSSWPVTAATERTIRDKLLYVWTVCL